jgi:hypothetical protein
MVAAFWDDLNSRTGAEVRYAVEGSAPNRTLVVEWFDLHARETSQHVTFQAKVFETSNVIEFHYCTLDVGTSTGTQASRVIGDSATIGLETPDGRSGIQHSFDVTNAISTTNALRFTP